MTAVIFLILSIFEFAIGLKWMPKVEDTLTLVYIVGGLFTSGLCFGAFLNNLRRGG